MKKSLLLPMAVMSLFLSAFVFNACQKETKETLVSRKEENRKEKPPVSTKSCIRPIFEDKVANVHCSEGRTCGPLSSIPSTSRNRISWRVGTPCPGSPNFVGTTYYTIYKRSSTALTNYNQITTFSCTNASMWYASTLLSNSSTFIIVSNYLSTALPATIVEGAGGYLYDTLGNPLSVSDLWKFSTGTTAGTSPCMITDDPAS
ncbi:hypothetical protein [Fluviicola sp.]|uniref:hypothetical protein n=1 Tax=Fluviicola sp. TaxID=1917219 RepID=UPI002628BEC8|nr:hypothetical protein [Fluviicola sp.]